MLAGRLLRVSVAPVAAMFLTPKSASVGAMACDASDSSPAPLAFAARTLKL